MFADMTASVPVMIWFAGNVIYYMVAEPSMSHMASLCAVTTLLAWWRLSPAVRRSAASTPRR